ncbi:tetratricopeptide repeat protein [uncultured Winogradskyella sp.]|uniref:tetratricopeptide repeat protein n=1 Tax=uncultured Winogradskyella sp. TaxID=395353 RepID=UPI00262C1CC9|nr:tetratricopeptide repeat protein [uncultured Winogradskyella sp.]
MIKPLMFKLSTVFLCCVISVKAQNSKQNADQLFANGYYSKAIEAYNLVAEKAEVYDNIAKAYIAIGNYNKAALNYENAIASNPDNLLFKYEYAKLLTKTKRYTESGNLYRKLIEIDSLNPNYHYELGIVLEKQKDTLAISEFIKAYRLDGNHQKAIIKIAKRHIYKRRFKQANTLIDKGLQTNSEQIELISLKAQAYYYQEYYTHAVVWFNKLIDLGEESEFIHEKLSLSYAQNSDYEDAIRHRRKALKYSPNDANAMFVIGTYYQRLSNFEKAEEYMSKSLKLRDVSLSDDYQRLGTVLNRQKKYKQAIKAFQKSLKEDSSNVMSEFFIIRTKDEYYADIDTKIKMYQDFLKKRTKSPFRPFAEQRLGELKQEKFSDKD